eukprot:3315263-Prorocentrum_lima.AAC.1
MKCRNSNVAEGGRSLANKKGEHEVGVYCFADVHKSYAWSSYTRATRLTEDVTYWSVVVEGVSCAKQVGRRFKRERNTQITIPEEHFHITAVLIKGFHPSELAND